MTLQTLAEYRDAGYLTTKETVRRLGIKPATLYAYVSRGLLEARRPSDGRASVFHPDEVERLRTRRGRSSRPELSIPSAITLLRPDGLFYRGVDAVPLAVTRSFEQVAHLLWYGAAGAGDRGQPGDSSPPGDLSQAGAGARWQARAAAIDAARSAQRALAPDALPLERMQAAVTALATTDPLRFDVTPQSAARLAPALITAMISGLGAGEWARGAGTRQPGAPGPSVARDLAIRLSGGQLPGGQPPDALVRIVNAALVLLADHELAASTVAVRIAAATRSTLYGCVAAGLSVLSGPLHGGTSLRAEDLLAQIPSPARAEAVIRAQLSRGDRLWGFGHPLYEDGDPRATELLRLVLESAPAARRETVEAVLAFGSAHSLPPPNVDLALGALTHCWSLARGSGQAIFAVGRTAGWTAHAIEEYERKADYRIRAVYTGPPPDPPPAPARRRS